MKRLVLMLILSITFLLQADSKKMLLILPNGYGANFYLLKQNFEAAGWDITLTGTTQPVAACTAFATLYGVQALTVDTLLEDISDVTDWDALVISHGTQWVGEPFSDLVNNTHVHDLIRQAMDSNLVVFATCTGVRVLAAADVLNGRLIQAHENVRAECLAAGAIWAGTQVKPVIDNNLVTTTRGMYYNHENSEAISTALEQLRATQFGGGQ